MSAEVIDANDRATEQDHPVATPKEPRRMPRYVVIVEDDEHHTFPYVIDVLREICGHTRQRAYQLTNQVHFRGQAHVWVGALEHAELKRELIHSYGPDIYARDPVSFPLRTRLERLDDD